MAPALAAWDPLHSLSLAKKHLKISACGFDHMMAGALVLLLGVMKVAHISGELQRTKVQDYVCVSKASSSKFCKQSLETL